MNQSINFPNPLDHDFAEWVQVGDYYYNASDIIAFGGELTVGNLQNAYRNGIFPWYIEGFPLPWFCPKKRAVLEFAELHVPRTLRKELKNTQFNFTIDKNFRGVIESCSKIKRAGEAGTWITPEFIRAYTEFHEAGKAHSVEVWDENGELVGGLYGVDTGGVFCGESMFHLQPNASKMALLHLVEHLERRGAAWLDIQVMTPHFKVFGAKDIPRKEFLDKLKNSQSEKLILF